MNRRRYLIIGLLTALIFLALPVRGDEKVIKLPAPRRKGGMPLMQALSLRQSTREFSPKGLSMQEISNILWAAFGINRPESDKRTAPSAHNMQEIDIYVSTGEGLYLYGAKENRLKLIIEEDIREATGLQDFVKEAALNLVYVADMARMDKIPEPERELLATADTGFISQNVYLYSASEGLATVVRGWVDKEKLAKKMNLTKQQKIILAQTVGYPKE